MERAKKMASDDRVEIDPVTDTATTGHEWDGIKELNTPLPKWWVYVFYLTIIWSVAYWIAMPSWPTGGEDDYLQGVLDYAQRDVVARKLAEAEGAQADFWNRVATEPLSTIRSDETLLAFALAGGDTVFGDNCAGCHGTSGAGRPGYPNLLDDAWLWGGSLEDIHTTLLYGIRADHEETRDNVMMAFGRDGLLERDRIRQVVSYVLSLSGADGDREEIAAGETVFAENCAACHGDDGRGIAEMGAPDLTDRIWLYGGDRASVTESVVNGRAGVMPAWVDRLSPEMIKLLTVYVHAQGGGQ